MRMLSGMMVCLLSSTLLLRINQPVGRREQVEARQRQSQCPARYLLRPLGQLQLKSSTPRKPRQLLVDRIKLQSRLESSLVSSSSALLLVASCSGYGRGGEENLRRSIAEKRSQVAPALVPFRTPASNLQSCSNGGRVTGVLPITKTIRGGS